LPQLLTEEGKTVELLFTEEKQRSGDADNYGKYLTWHALSALGNA
jgi:hypothetical protein